METIIALCLLLSSVTALRTPLPTRNGAHNRFLGKLYSTSEDLDIQTSPKVPAAAWKWPPVWPFPADFVEYIDYDSSSQPPLSEKARSSFKKFLSTSISDSDNVLEIGSASVTLTTETSARSFVDFEEVLKSSKLPYEANTFDKIVVSAGIESYEDPRNVYKDIWRVLKPDGKCYNCFSNRAYVPISMALKMWTNMNDEQKIWIAGSYYHYSAGEGWSNIEGFDLLKSTGSEKMVFENGVRGEDDAAYVVSASKVPVITPDSPDFSAFNFTKFNLLGSNNLGKDDIEFSAYRIDSDYQRASTKEAKEVVLTNVFKLNGIYEVLKEVKDIVIPPPVKAMLANFLLPKWEDTPEQKEALRQGLGLITPDDYWKPLGTATSALPPREKILFLANIAPEFGGNPNIASLPTLMQIVNNLIRAKLPDVDEANLQIFIADIVVTDYLNVRSANASDRLLKFIEVTDAAKINEMIKERAARMVKNPL